MQKTGLFELQAVMMVAQTGGFRAAAVELDISPSALSHAVNNLEAKLGVRLFNRTTRSVSLSKAGEQFLARVKPALQEIQDAMSEANDARNTLSGTLRLNMAERAAQEMLRPVIIEYLRRYPQMHIDLITDARLIDIVADGFDAGFRLAEAVPQDMVSVPLGPDGCVRPPIWHATARHRKPRTTCWHTAAYAIASPAASSTAGNSSATAKR